MSVELLSDLQQEVRRLFIAGSAMAQGDMRLTKLLPQLKKLGEAAPVFNRLAESSEGLLGATREESPAKLLELAALLSAVLHTQGKTETPGEASPIETLGISLNTDVTYRKLQPVIEALTTKGPGRLELLRQSVEYNSYLDLRLLPAVCRGLDDSFHEISDYVQMNLIPGFGHHAIPVLKSQLNLQGGKADARRLQILHGLLGKEMIALLMEAATSGSVDLKVPAISLLGGYPEYEPFLLERSREKRKEVRLSAYHALASIGSDQATARLYEALCAKDNEIVVEPIQQCVSYNLYCKIIELAEKEFDRYESTSGSEQVQAMQQLHIALRCLEGPRKQFANAALPLLKKLLLSPAFIVIETEAVQETATELLLGLEDIDSNQFAMELHYEHKKKLIGCSFRAAYRLLDRSELFVRYSGEFAGLSASAKEMQRAIRVLVAEQLQQDENASDAIMAEGLWDSRWVQLFAEQEWTDLVCVFTHELEPSITNYLVTRLKEDTYLNSPLTRQILHTLYRIGYPKTPQLIMNLLKSGESLAYFYLDWKSKRLITMMPKESMPALREIAEQLASQSTKKQLNEIIDTLESAPDEILNGSEPARWEWIQNRIS
ncbi:HEAT repeat domain-containing protein [Paenibacillus sp. MMS18-CY102]|uniref:HEAT repeat domain-containing protein n=1 Tax=Paenibacillus sp. MMS18-CY102 TaxID=2682849 RepID=UPI001365D68C|nr:HEAT repeat domain-containing protein [Paenibacillus sp. MMS18-CY102]MWC29832.1 hypothetical protein [Paenibacillus sp. MMS18-CY102]